MYFGVNNYILKESKANENQMDKQMERRNGIR